MRPSPALSQPNRSSSKLSSTISPSGSISRPHHSRSTRRAPRPPVPPAPRSSSPAAAAPQQPCCLCCWASPRATPAPALSTAPPDAASSLAAPRHAPAVIPVPQQQRGLGASALGKGSRRQPPARRGTLRTPQPSEAGPCRRARRSVQAGRTPGGSWDTGRVLDSPRDRFARSGAPGVTRPRGTPPVTALAPGDTAAGGGGKAASTRSRPWRFAFRAPGAARRREPGPHPPGRPRTEAALKTEPISAGTGAGGSRAPRPRNPAPPLRGGRAGPRPAASRRSARGAQSGGGGGGPRDPGRPRGTRARSEQQGLAPGSSAPAGPGPAPAPGRGWGVGGRPTRPRPGAGGTEGGRPRPRRQPQPRRAPVKPHGAGTDRGWPRDSA